MCQKAFTLIELLVVIAIIAILASILFPVFAQAKAAAKATASVSNEKQQSLAVLMYSSDVDDMAPVDCIWGQHDALYWFGSWSSAFSPWTYEVTPYTKNGAIFNDPQISPNPGGSDTGWYAYNPEYGYNYTALSPITSTSGTGPNKWIRTPVSLSSVSRPSETVMVSAHNAANEDIGWYWWNAGTLLISPYTVEAPDCYDIAPTCIDNWGSGWLANTWLENNRAAGAFTGSNSLRKSGNAIAGFCDGHVKTMPPGQLAAGTNWNPNIADSQLVMVNSKNYLWGNFQ
ncbi:MAG: prepilin-type N-terminal cleavage/methylation domain-containing protein [Fimbriimonas sp.]|nr:prepilin-type N-terminal cleavage/methylation domain-containing protein [Fimbriimonas sp.]